MFCSRVGKDKKRALLKRTDKPAEPLLRHFRCLLKNVRNTHAIIVIFSDEEKQILGKTHYVFNFLLSGGADLLQGSSNLEETWCRFGPLSSKKRLTKLFARLVGL